MRELVAHHKGDRNTHPHPPAMSAGSYPRTHALRPALTLTLAAPPGNALKTRGCSVLSARCLRRMFRGFCVRPPHASAAPSLCSPMSPRFAPRPPSLVPSPGHATGPLGRRVTAPSPSPPPLSGPWRPRGLARRRLRFAVALWSVGLVAPHFPPTNSLPFALPDFLKPASSPFKP